MVHRTPTRDKIKLLSARARELDDMLAVLSHEYGAETPDSNPIKNSLTRIKLEFKPKSRG